MKLKNKITNKKYILSMIDFLRVTGTNMIRIRDCTIRTYSNTCLKYFNIMAICISILDKYIIKWP